MAALKRKKLFVTFEGGEGSGKTTQITILAKRLAKEGYAYLLSREPGGTDIGEKIRKITHDLDNVDITPIAESYLMAAARAQHVEEIIKPALKQKTIVLCDRFVDSSVAYQGMGRGIGAEIVAQLNELAVSELVPDVTIYLDITPNEGLKRKKNAGKKLDRMDKQKPDFYVKIYRGYRKLIQQDKNAHRWVVLDAESDQDILAEKIWTAVEAALKNAV